MWNTNLGPKREPNLPLPSPPCARASACGRGGSSCRSGKRLWPKFVCAVEVTAVMAVVMAAVMAVAMLGGSERERGLRIKFMGVRHSDSDYWAQAAGLLVLALWTLPFASLFQQLQALPLSPK